MKTIFNKSKTIFHLIYSSSKYVLQKTFALLDIFQNKIDFGYIVISAKKGNYLNKNIE